MIKRILYFLFFFTTLIAEAQLTVTVANVEHNQCFGVADGEITVDVTGGIGPYSISIFGDTAGFRTDFIGPVANFTYAFDQLAASPGFPSYFIVVQDNGSVPVVNAFSSAVEIIETNPLVVVETIVDVQCSGDNSGAISLAIPSETGSFMYEWFDGANNSIAKTRDISSLGPDTYTVNIVDDAGCDHNYSYTVSALNQLNADFIIPSDTCLGVFFTVLDQSSGDLSNVSYAWDFGVDAMPATSTLVGDPLVEYSSTGLKTVKLLIDNTVCKDSIEKNITIESLPALDVGLNQVICEGDTASIEAITSDVFLGWSPIVEIEDPTSASTKVFPIATQEYIGEAQAGNGCLSSDTVTIFVNPPPTVVVTPVNANLCEGDSVSLLASGANTYLWSPVLGLSDPSIANPIAKPLVSTRYVVQGTDVNGCTDTSSVYINVNTLPNVNAQANPSALCEGESTLLSTDFDPSYLYTWSSLNGAVISDPSIFNPIASPVTDETFKVVVEGVNGCKDSSSVNVTVDALPSISIAPFPSDTICKTETVNLSATGGVSYDWSPKDGSLSDPSISNPVASPNADTEYTVIVTGANGCTDSLKTTIYVEPVINITTSINDTICAGDIVVITATATNAVSYSWSPLTDVISGENTNVLTASPSATITYVVTVENSIGCTNSDSVEIQVVNPLPITISNDTTLCVGDSVLFVADVGVPGYSYSWSPTFGLSDPNSGSTYARAIFSGLATYTVTANHPVADCPSTESVDLLVNDIPVLVLNNDTTICLGDTALLKASGADSYVWSPSSSLSTTIGNVVQAFPVSDQYYKVVGLNGIGCSATDSILVSVNATPVLTTTISPDTICFGEQVQLEVQPSTLPTYIWQGQFLSDASIYNPTAIPTSSGVYKVVATDANGCSSADSVNVVVNTIPVFTTSSDTTICLGDTIQLSVSASGADVVVWSPNSFIDDINSYTPLVSPIVDTDYKVVVSNVAGCLDSAVVRVSVNDRPTGQVVASFDTICSGLDVVYTYALDPPFVDNLVGTYSIDGGISFSNTNTTTYFGVISGDTSINVIFKEVGGCVSLPETNSVHVLDQIDFEATIVAAADCGSPLGEILVENVVGGKAPYRLAKDGGVFGAFNVDSTFSNLDVGSHVFEMVDDYSCSNSETVTFSSSLTYDSVLVHPVCNGENTGSIEITNVLGGGGAPYEFSLNDNLSYGPSSLFSNLIAGIYLVYIKDASGCEIPVSLELIDPTLLTSSIINQSNINCVGDTASVEVAVNGGVSPYVFDLNGDIQTGLGPVIFNNLSAGTDTVLVSDNVGCSLIVPFTITEVEELSSGFSEVSQSACGLNDGQAQIDSTVGGSGVYAYSYLGLNSFTDSASFTVQLDGLTAGLYSVVTRDEVLGCTDTTDFTITKIDGIDVSLINVDVSPSCSGVDGIIALSNFIGNAPRPYQFELRDLVNDTVVKPVQTDSVFTAVVMGSYRVVIYDALNCTEELSVNVPFSTSLNIVIDTTDASCGLPNGKVVLSISGGLSPYYSSIGDTLGFSTDTVFDNLNSGNYNFYIKDSSSPYCLDSVNVDIEDVIVKPSGAAFLAQDTVCSGSPAIITAVLDAPYVENSGGTYSFDGGVTFGTSNTILLDIKTPGDTTINVVFRDAINCAFSDTVPVVVHSLNPISFVVDTPAVPSCLDLGSIRYSSFMGGNGNLTYSVNGDPFIPVKDTLIENLTSGIYTVIVIDEYMCFKSEVTDLRDPLEFDSDFASPTCYGDSDGSISFANLTGGVAPYLYSYGDTASASFGPDSVFTNLSAGAHVVYIKDNGDCIIPVNVNLFNPDSIQIIQTGQVDLTCSDNDLGGLVSVNVSGGTGTLTSITQGQQFLGSGDFDFDSLAVGVDTIFVSDANGCSSILPYEILDEPNIISIIAQVNAGSCTEDIGKAIIFATIGGSGVYNYKYFSDTSFVSKNEMEMNMDSLALGIYTVVTNDVLLSCTSTSSFIISRLDGVDSLDVVSDNSCNDLDGSFDIVQVYQTIPSSPYTFQLEDLLGNLLQGPQTDSQFVNLSQGEYVIVVTDNLGCSDYFVDSIAAPDTINYLLNINNTLCGDDNGEIEISNLSNGKAPYTFELIGERVAQSDSVFEDLAIGFYELLIEDSNSPNCTVLDSVYVGSNEADALISYFDVNCYNGSDGIVIVHDLLNTDTTVFDYTLSMDLSKQFTSDTIFDSLSVGLQQLFIKQTHKVTGTSCTYTDFNKLYDVEINGVYYDSIITDVIPIGQGDSLFANLEITPSNFETPTGAVEVLDVQGGTAPYVIKFQDEDAEVFNGPVLYEGLYQTEVGSRPAYQLLLMDDSSCAQLVNIEVPSDFYVPNVITPNGDGKNDRLLILGLSEGTRVRIFDRWGVMVYENYSYDNINAWDANGNQDGTFYYEIQTIDNNFHSGWIQVVR